jgi:lipoprotein-anchoring transpeptidase ErfK/SrfK
VVAKRKRVDTISAKVVKNKNTSVVQEKTKPLLSIIEPGVESVHDEKRKEKKKPFFRKRSDTKQPEASSESNETKSINIEANVEKFEEKTIKPLLKRHHKIIMASCGFLVFLVVITGIMGGGAYAQQAMYENKVFPGVMVWGVEAGGKSMTEVQQLIAEKVKTYKITIKGPDQDYTATAAELGVIYNSDSMALGAYSRGRSSSAAENYFTRARLLATKISWAPWQQFIRADDLVISPSYTIDDGKFDVYLTQVADNIKISAQDSEVNVIAGQVQLKPAIYGREVKIEELKKQIKNSIAGFNKEEVLAETVSIKPAIIDDAAQEVMIQAQNVMQRPVILTYQGAEYRPNQETIASWISFIKNTGDTNYTLVVNPEKMKSYFDFLGTKINIYPVSKKIRIENGVKETEIQPGSNGTLVDTDLLGKTIANQLPNQASVTVVIPTYIAIFKTEYERVIIADWEKYIDINLSTQTMTACERGGVNCKQWSVTTGKNGTATPTGTFLILGRSANFYMTGGTPGIDYYKVWVDRAVWFTSQGHAIHDAAWRNGSFGGQDYTWNGSHGCVNSPDDAANFIYDWAPVGTPVIIHY